MNQNAKLLQGRFGLALMLIFSTTLVVKPKSIGFVEGILFSMSYNRTMAISAAFVPIIITYFAAFILSFYAFKKNRTKIFYCIIFFTIFKWVVDIFSISTILNLGFEVKLWAIFAFFVGAYLTKTAFVASNKIPN